MDGWIHRQTEMGGWTNRLTDRDGWMDRWLNDWMNRQTDGCIG